MKNLDRLFRPALLLMLVAGLIVATWHISWLHKQPGARYEMQTSDWLHVRVLDQQERVVYSAAGSDAPLVWEASPLPK